MNNPIIRLLGFGMLALTLSAVAFADTPVTEDGVTTIHLDQYNGYFAAEETLAGLEPGTYEFVVTNKAGKVAGFQVQSLESREQLTMFPLEPGETKSSRVEISSEGFRYRCPINPTPWYEVGVSG
ncbi:MAG: hypothetical protein KFF45_02375 [Thioalkalivibrio sp.]|nr:hypothetical protein [Thioalkalivibrio sp.]